MVRNAAVFQEVDKKLPGHAKKIRRCLRGECLILRQHNYGLAFPHQTDDTHEVLIEWLRQLGLSPIAVNQRDVTRFREGRDQLVQSLASNNPVKMLGSLGPDA